MVAVQGCHCSGPPRCTLSEGAACQGPPGGVSAPHVGAQESLAKERLCGPWGGAVETVLASPEHMLGVLSG